MASSLRKGLFEGGPVSSSSSQVIANDNTSKCSTCLINPAHVVCVECGEKTFCTKCFKQQHWFLGKRHSTKIAGETVASESDERPHERVTPTPTTQSSTASSPNKSCTTKGTDPYSYQSYSASAKSTWRPQSETRSYTSSVPPSLLQSRHYNFESPGDSTVSSTGTRFTPLQPKPSWDFYGIGTEPWVREIELRVSRWTTLYGHHGFVSLLQNIQAVAPLVPRPQCDDWSDVEKVKRSYLKLCRHLHPDKLVSATDERRMEAKLVFEALQQAFDVFYERSGNAHIYAPANFATVV